MNDIRILIKHVLSCILIFLAITCGCRKINKITIVIPDGYRGVFEIVEDAKRSPVDSVANCKKNLFVIPQNGILITPSVSVFNSHHQVVVLTAGGNIVFEDSEHDSNFHSLFLRNDDQGRRTIWFYIGDINKFYKKYPSLIHVIPGPESG